MKYYLPILLQNKTMNDLQIDTDIKIRKITQFERETFFGVKKIDFEFVNNKFGLNKVSVSDAKKGIYDYSKWIWRHTIDDTSEIFASNYIIECDINNETELHNIIENLNISFNILQPTDSGCYVAFKDGDLSVLFIQSFNQPLNNRGFLNLKQKNRESLKKIYQKIKFLKKEEKLKFDLFMNGLHNHVSMNLKFLSLVMALENIFLPEKGLEIKLRFSLRITKVIGKKIKNKDDIYNTARNIYDIRSDIIHSGGVKNKLTKEVYEKTIVLTWLSLNEYINNSDQFTRKHIEKMHLY